MAGTVVDIFTLMEMLDQELETGAGENDETAALAAVNQAQLYLENVAAQFPRVLQDTVNVSTTASQETTTFTSGLLRLDAVWLLDDNGLPIKKLESIQEVGGHVPNLPWPIDLVATNLGTGTPYAFYANMANFYWLPMPDAVKNIRVYGLVRKARFTARTDAVNYDYDLHLPMAQFATKLLQIGADDVSNDLTKLGSEVFLPTLKARRNFDRTGPKARHYTEFHTT